ncbi:transposase family protein [Streptomyces sp. NPDC058084]|uniref:helix-turn-helix domain-containing protein n=1 Tax=Streptomyces sp. NPDC058084 TaxID=3346333 RepID=UPI0036F02AD1
MDPRQFNRVVRALRSEGADITRRGRPWGIPLEDRVLLVAAYWRTNLTLRQLAPLFGVSKSAAGRIVRQVGPFWRSGPGSGFARTPCSSWTALWFPPAITRWRSGPRTTGTRRITRWSSIPTPD